MPTAQELQRFYAANQQSRFLRPEDTITLAHARSRSDTARRVAFVTQMSRPGSAILDVGAGYGFFVAAMRHHAELVVGTDTSAARRARAVVPIAPEIPSNTVWDVITMFHVLEHLPDPVGVCQAMRALLRPGGRLVIEVPNVEDDFLRQNSAYREFWFQTAHLTYFSPRSLPSVLRAAGFARVEVDGVQRYGLANHAHWEQFGTPQLESPAFSRARATPGSESEVPWRRRLEVSLTCDTLIAVATNR